MTTGTKPLRVIQWATGAIGKLNIVTLAKNPAFELVGCYVFSAAKHGKDAGEIAGIGPIGVKATNDVDEVLAIPADVVLYAPMLARPSEICRILESGKNVVTPAGFTTILDPKVQARIQASCEKGGVSFHGSGIHPGFADRLALILSAMSRSIDKITVYEIVDMSQVNESWEMVKILGFDMTPEEAKNDPPPVLAGMGKTFFESIALVAQGLGIPIDRYEKSHEFAIGKRDIEISLDLGTKTGIVRRGHVAGQNFNYFGKVGDETVIEFKTYWKMGKDLEPNWPYDEALAYLVEVEGDPDLHLRFTLGKPDGSDATHAGLLGTAQNCVNTAPLVVAAKPGFVTQLDLPMITGYEVYNTASSR